MIEALLTIIAMFILCAMGFAFGYGCVAGMICLVTFLFDGPDAANDTFKALFLTWK